MGPGNPVLPPMLLRVRKVALVLLPILFLACASSGPTLRIVAAQIPESPDAPCQAVESSVVEWNEPAERNRRVCLDTSNQVTLRTRSMLRARIEDSRFAGETWYFVYLYLIPKVTQNLHG